MKGKERWPRNLSATTLWAEVFFFFISSNTDPNRCYIATRISYIIGSVMIAQWENECTSLSDVLSVTWVMMAQWEKECISLSVLPVAWVMIAQRDNE